MSVLFLFLVLGNNFSQSSKRPRCDFLIRFKNIQYSYKLNTGTQNPDKIKIVTILVAGVHKARAFEYPIGVQSSWWLLFGTPSVVFL